MNKLVESEFSNGKAFVTVLKFGSQEVNVSCEANRTLDSVRLAATSVLSMDRQKFTVTLKDTKQQFKFLPRDTPDFNLSANTLLKLEDLN